MSKEEDFPSLPSKKGHRQRMRGSPPENLLYEDESEITSLADLKGLLEQEIPTYIAEQDQPFPIQVAISLSQIKSVPPAQLRAQKRSQEEKICELDRQIENLQMVLSDLKQKISDAQHDLKLLLQEQDFERAKQARKPQHIALRNLGELISFEASHSEIKQAFFELPTNLQKILLRVKNLIPQEILQKQVTLSSPVFQAVAESTEIQVSAKLGPHTFVESMVFNACAFIQKSTNESAMVSLGDTDDVSQALKILKDKSHSVIQNICQVTCISDSVNDCLTLSLYDETNSRHTKKPHGVLSMIVLYHINNEKTVIDMINTELSQGIWNTDYKRDLHKRLLANRNKML